MKLLQIICLFFFIQLSFQKLPNKLKSGDEIRIVAPSGFLTQANRQQLKSSIDLLTSWNLKVTIGENIFKNSTPRGGFAGTDEERISDFNKAIEDPKVKAIFCARGGYGTPRIIEKIKFNLLKQNPKFVIGYSDITLILLFLESNSILGGVHASMPASSGFTDPLNSKSIHEIIFHHKPMSLVANHFPQNRNGKSKGKIIAGNVSLMANSLGTKGEIQTDGKILLIEEISENLYVCMF
jgi:muramoyltetrapeptide carboxypeptidase